MAWAGLPTGIRPGSIKAWMDQVNSLLRNLEAANVGDFVQVTDTDPLELREATVIDGGTP